MGEIGGVGEGKQEAADVSDASDQADISADAPKQADPFDPREDNQQQSVMSNGDKQGPQTRTEQGDTSPAPGDAENSQGSGEPSQQDAFPDGSHQDGSPEDSQQDAFPDGSHQDGSTERSQQDAFPDGSQQNDNQSEVRDTQGEYGDPFDPRNDQAQTQSNANIETSHQNDNQAQAQTEDLQRNDSQSQDYSKQGEYGDPFDPRNDQPQAQPDTNKESPQQNDGQTQVHDTQGEYGDPFDPRNDQPQEQSNANGHEANGELQSVRGEQAGRDDPFHPSQEESNANGHEANAHEANGELQSVHGEQAGGDDPFHPSNDGQAVEGTDKKESEEIKDTKEKIKYGELDEYERPTGIQATLTKEMIGTGSEANSSIIPPDFQGGEVGHARGHLLARQLGGSGNEQKNLVTLHQNPVNTPQMSNVERQVRKAVESGETVEYSVIPEYNGSEGMPAAINIEAKGDRGFHISRRIENKK